VKREKDKSELLEDDYEKKWQEKNKSKLEKEAEMIRAMEGLDEETKLEKLKELKLLMEAEIVDEESTTTVKASQFDFKTHKLEVEKDFTDLAIKVSAKLKADKKHKHFLAFLKKINLSIIKDFTIEMENDLLEGIKLIKNKKKKDEKKSDVKKEPVKVVKSSSKRMEMDVAVELNPDYKPRNHQLYEDFM
jgi:hypothetical protein